MKNITNTILATTALLSVACTDSFDLEPSSSVPTDKVYKTAEDFNEAVIDVTQIADTSLILQSVAHYRSDNLTLSAPLPKHKTVMISISLQIKPQRNFGRCPGEP